MHIYHAYIHIHIYICTSSLKVTYHTVHQDDVTRHGHGRPETLTMLARSLLLDAEDKKKHSDSHAQSQFTQPVRERQECGSTAGARELTDREKRAIKLLQDAEEMDPKSGEAFCSCIDEHSATGLRVCGVWTHAFSKKATLFDDIYVVP
jgi:hypothetical protein